MPGIQDADIIVVGGGIMAAAVTATIRASSSAARIVMLDAGAPIGPLPGQHLRDVAAPEVEKRYNRQVASGNQGLYLGAQLNNELDAESSRSASGMYGLSALGNDTAAFPASAVALNAGGMGVHWFTAAPSPWGSEAFGDDAGDTWATDLERARRLLSVHPSPFGAHAAGTRVLDALEEVFGPASVPGRHPQTMPMAMQPGGRRRVRTGPNQIFPPIAFARDDAFELHTSMQVVEILHEGSASQGVRVRDLVSAEEFVVRGRIVIVCADAVRTPQLLFASGIRPHALGRHLNEHAFLAGRVDADARRLGIDLESVPPIGDEVALGAYWLPHSDADQPFHGQIINRLTVDDHGAPATYEVGIAWYVPTEIRDTNRLEFSASEQDATGMPRITAHFDYSPNDLALIEAGRQSQQRAGDRIGDFDVAADSVLLPPGSSLHYTGTVRSGRDDDGTSVCSPDGRVWGFDNVYVAGNGVVPTALACNSTLAGTITAVRAGRAVAAHLEESRVVIG